MESKDKTQRKLFAIFQANAYVIGPENGSCQKANIDFFIYNKIVVVFNKATVFMPNCKSVN